MKRFRIKIISGQYANRYVGLPFSGSLVTNPEMQKNPPVNVPSTKYGLYVQEEGATQFFEQGANEAFAKLRALGYQLEMVEV